MDDRNDDCNDEDSGDLVSTAVIPSFINERSD